MVLTVRYEFSFPREVGLGMRGGSQIERRSILGKFRKYEVDPIRVRVQIQNYLGRGNGKVLGISILGSKVRGVSSLFTETRLLGWAVAQDPYNPFASRLVPRRCTVRTDFRCGFMNTL